MRIKKIELLNLFGVFKHEIELNLDERITIVHGPNGYGKTILLKMVNSFFNSKYSELRNSKYDLFKMTFEDNSFLEVRQENSKDLKNKKKHSKCILHISFTFNGSTQTLEVKERELDYPVPLHILESETGLNRTGPNTWREHYSDVEYTTEEVVEKYSDLLPPSYALGRNKSEKPEPEWLVDLKESVKTKLIETQRLFAPMKRGRDYRFASSVPAVNAYSDDLMKQIQKTLAESAELTQSLDRDFPQRLVSEASKEHPSETDLKSKMSGLETKRQKLMDAGLLDKKQYSDFLSLAAVDQTTKNILSVYLRDVEKKLSIFDNIAQKIELLTKIVNQRFRYKTFSVDKDKGFSFITGEGNTLSLGSLSSGEQHELVLIYELLFKLEPGSLVLLDEPELSLHVAWQEQFLRDLEDVTKLSSLDVLIATHSPQIINDRWDLTVELKGPPWK